MSTTLRLVVNNARRSLTDMFPGFFGTAKHNHVIDFGYPSEVTFADAYDAYCRNPLARAAVDKTVGKTWEDNPFLQEFQRDGSKPGQQKETTLEAQIRQRFDDLRIWQHMAEADRRGLVGRYAGLILRFADGQPFDQPVGTVAGGLNGLVEVIPAWEGQLTVAEWETDVREPNYGKPKRYQFSESSVGKGGPGRQVVIHPDRILIWSRDGTLHGRSALEPGFNALLDCEKIRGGGGEGFWKNAKSGLSLEIDKDAKLTDMARAMGVEPQDVADKVDEQVADFNKGFDRSLMLQGMKATPIQVSLPSPEHFFAVAVQSFAASWSMPLKILLGSQTGERASTEDASEWAKVNRGRRTNEVVPTIMSFVQLLERVGILPNKDWFLSWTDLTESSMAEKVDRVAKMAEVNSKMGDELVFTGDDLRSVVGMEPLTDAQRFRDDVTDTDAAHGAQPATADDA